MKKSKFLWVALILVFIMSISAITAFAASEPTLTIKTTSLELENTVHMNFKVQSQNIRNTSNVKLLVWDSYPGEYIKGTEDAVLSILRTEANTGYLVFRYTNLAAKDMTKFVYVCAYANINGVEIYSKPTKFSIIQYAYNAQSDAKLKPLLDNMLAYGASAQTYFNYKTDFLATDPIVKVRVEGGTHADGFKTMYYQKGETATLTANAPEEGMVFSHWVNSAGISVGTDSTLLLPMNQDDTYTAIYMDKNHDPQLYNDDYGYQYLGTMEKGSALQKLYNLIDEVAYKFHTDTNINATNNVVGAFNYTSLGLTTNDAEAVWMTYKNDHPLYYWISTTLQYNGNELILLTEDEYANGTTRAIYNKLVYDSVKEYTLDLSDETTNYRITLALHDSIIYAIDYAYEEDGVTPQDDIWAHNILGVFEKQSGVCESYARTFQLLLNYLDIDNIFVTGTSKGSDHAWNLVKMDDGQWYWFDLTWDDSPNWMWGISYNYFCVNDTQNTTSKDGGYEYGFQTFPDIHTINTPNYSDGHFLYALPERSASPYAGEHLLREIFTIDDYTYVVVGYNTVQLTRVKSSGTAVIPETVNHAGVSYTVISIGCISSSGYLGTSDVWDDPVVFASTVEQVNIPKTVKFIWDNAFRSQGLKHISVDETSSYFASVDGVLFTKDLKALISYPRKKENPTFDIPDQTIGIANYAFEKCLLKEVTIGKSVECFGVVNWGRGWVVQGIVYVVGNHIIPSFSENYYEDLVIKVSPEHPHYKVIDHGIYWDTTFVRVDSLVGPSKIEIAQGTKDILSLNSNSVVEVIIPESVESIPQLDNCYSLVEICNNSSVNISPSMAKQAKHIYNSTSGRSKLIYEDDCVFYKDGDTLSLVSYLRDSELTCFTIPDGVTSIGDYAFYCCPELTTVIIPDSVTSIGHYAFSHCSNLMSVVFSDSLMSIGHSAFSRCSNLMSVVFPDSLTSIGHYAFLRCSNLMSVTLGKAVTSIGVEAFTDCYKLREVINHSQLAIYCRSTDHGFVAYHAKTVHSGTSKLHNQDGFIFISDLDYNLNLLLHYVGSNTTIVLPERYNGKTYEIDQYAFADCSNLTSVTIPEGVTIIWNNAFYGCINLTNLTIPDSVSYIYDNAFYGCVNLTNLTIPSGGISIGKDAFYGCTKLIYTVNGVQYVNDIAIGCASSITGITLPKNTHTIGNYAFSSRANLKSIIIPDSVTLIGSYAFSYCDNLESIIIPDSVTSIKVGAFYKCPNLTSVYYMGSQDQWSAICIQTIPNNALYFYSEIQPTDAGNYWHYVNGTPTKW